MDLNTAMRFVMVRAYAEAAAVGMELYPEHLFLGLLKLAEITAEDIAPNSRHKDELNEDIEQVATQLKTSGIESGEARIKLRRLLRNETPAGNGETDIANILSQAAVIGKGDVIAASHVLSVMLKVPTSMLAALFSLAGQQLAHTPNKEEIKQEQENMGIAFLPKLTERIRSMRYALLEKIHGQDHAVHAFAEGIFNSEVLAFADKKRKSPRAIFVFAGSPGVGKTFLAEQAAQALDIPFKRFDMSSYADHQAQINLIGFAPSYKDAKPGQLTGFVKDNPHCILLFDEIEKAHINTVQLFLQILDAGILHDDFTDGAIAFKDTIIIFTTNAGRQLYEGEHKINAAGIPHQTILNALETDTNPQTGKPYFPAAICSRLATGYLIIFNHLQTNDLEKICANEFNRLCLLFENQYNIKIDADKLLFNTLLFAEGGEVDARTLRAQTELFFKKELFKLCQLWGENMNAALEKLKTIHFEVTTENLSPDVMPLFQSLEQQEILFFGNNIIVEKLKKEISNITLYSTQDVNEALKILSEQNICVVLLELFADNKKNTDNQGTLYAFDNVPMASFSLQESRHFFNLVRERLPKIPVYLLETSNFKIDGELLAAFVRAGARGKLILPQGENSVLVEEINDICAHLYLQSVAAELAAQHNVLSFETAPKLSPDQTQAFIRLRELSIRRAISADDNGNLLDEVEKPKTRFSDIIGATDAKDELQFFIHYLKNPKKFSALGLKPPKGVLLYGSPGTGKTLLARAMAGESDVAFIPAVASAFVTKYQGSGSEAVRELFNRARRYAPAIIFIDEIDAIGRIRGSSISAHGEEMALNALLTEMDGFSVDTKRPVFVLAATNFNVEEGKNSIRTIDAALVRRFDRKILVDLPNKEDRKRYLEMMFSKQKNSQVTEKMIERLANRSTGLSLADLELVIESSLRMSAKKSIYVNDELLEEAFELNLHGAKKEWGHDYLERVARHEAGHAYICYREGTSPSYLTIVARGGHGGYMEHIDDESSPIKTKDELLGRIRISLGGRAAEIVYYGNKDGITSGVSGDLQNATYLARTMICSYGMDEEIGMVALSTEEATRGFLSGKITQRISQIIEKELKQAIEIISEGKTQIDKLVEQLLEKNKLTKEEIENILRPWQKYE